MKRKCGVFVAAMLLLSCAATSSYADSSFYCHHVPGDAWFYGEHKDSVDYGIVEDANPFRAMKTGHDGQLFVISTVVVLELTGNQDVTDQPRIGQTVRVAQLISCTACNLAVSSEGRLGGIYSEIGEKRWFSASPRELGFLSNTLAAAGIDYDFVIDSFCDATPVRQVGPGEPEPEYDFNDLQPTPLPPNASPFQRTFW